MNMVDREKLSDEVLFSLSRKGDATAFHEIHKRYKGILLVHAYKKLGDFEEAKDLVQDLFLSIWQNRKRLPDTQNFSGYLYRALRNRVINTLLRKNVKNKYLDGFKKFYQEGRNETDEYIRERELAQQIEREINALPPKMREVFRLSRESQLPNRVIAEQLNISEFTVKNHIKKALKALRAKLGRGAHIFFIF